MKCEAVFSLAMGVACLALTGAVMAQGQYGASAPAASATADPGAGQQEAAVMVPAEANLVKPLDSRKVQPGSQFTATLAITVHLKDGTELPRGARLIGSVSTDDMQLSGNSKLALRITQAQLKDGKTIPIKATIVGIAAPGTPEYSASNPWTQHTLQVDQVDVMAGVDLHSRIAGENSGVFVATKKDNVKLGSGSEFMLAIASQQNVSSAGSGD